MLAACDVDGDTDVDTADYNLLMANIGATCASPGTLTGDRFYRADFNGDCVITFAGDIAAMLGNLGVGTDLGAYTGYEWDAENRLIKVTPLTTSPSNGMKRLEFDYDYQGRRVEKRMYTYDASTWKLTEQRRFVWYNWLMVMEIAGRDTDGNASLDETRTRKFTWGKDLGGSLESAGGIGGLLAVEDDNGTTTGGSPTADDMHYVYLYDANGNVGQVVDWAQTTASAALKAKYEYDVYANVTSSGGPYATANPFRFSTKYWDDETGLGYWGYRYYEPRMGRWVSRDPVDELGRWVLSRLKSVEHRADSIVRPHEPHTYAYVVNRATNALDPHGLKCSPGNGPNGCTGVPDVPFGYKFLPCCTKHDNCYCTCGNTQEGCDSDFADCMKEACDRAHSDCDPWNLGCYLSHKACLVLAAAYAWGVQTLGEPAFEAAQIDAGCRARPCPPPPPEEDLLYMLFGPMFPGMY